jgi:hypothetical protein
MAKTNTVAKRGYRFSDAGVHHLGHLFTVQEVAALLRCSVSSLNKWRLTGRGPSFVLVGARVRYCACDIAAYVKRQTRKSTSAEASPSKARAATEQRP